MYGHLWTLDELRDRLDVQDLAAQDDVSVYVLTGGS